MSDLEWWAHVIIALVVLCVGAVVRLTWVRFVLLVIFILTHIVIMSIRLS